MVWINLKRPWMWDDKSLVRLDVGLISVNENSFPCGEIREYSSTGYPQEKLFLTQSTSWRFPKPLPICGGMDL